jgi:hypothetical protein
LVSVNEAVNNASSLGRLGLIVRLSFAQVE